MKIAYFDFTKVSAVSLNLMNQSFSRERKQYRADYAKVMLENSETLTSCLDADEASPMQ